MKTSQEGINFLKAREGYRPKAKTDGAKYTIGYGNTMWEDGSPVREGQTITEARAEQLFRNILADFEKDVTALVSAKLTQSQFDALVSYAYNRGSYKFANTTLLKMVNANPNDPNIRKQFEIEWGTNTTYKNGLIKRRRLEAELYFSNSSGGTLAQPQNLLLLGVGAVLVGVLISKK
ncbi:lysozyme [Emticicia sp. 17c]|uniref:lysozyme n=1 Tax=Emticicia sp. 17c TaxID=3127704 RepID=UPI00301C871B